MYLELSEGEARALSRALELHLVRLQDEIVHTDDRDYTSGLRASFDVLESVRHKLEMREVESQEFA